MTVQPEQSIKRELSLGEVIQKTFELYQRDFTKYFVLFAIVGAIIGVVMTIARQIFILPTLPSNPPPQQIYTWLPGFFATLILLIENRGVLDSMGKSRQLVSHRWLKTFATFLVLAIIVIIASAIVNAITGPLGIASPVVNGILSAFYQPLFPILMTVYYYSNLARITTLPADQMPTTPTMTAQAGMKFCPSCGTQLASSATFCSKCGAKLN